VIPPLRDRPREIGALAASFLSAACHDLERAPPPAISEAALGLLRRHAWPGNVRELRNVIERAVVMCAESTILPEHLPPSLFAASRFEQGRSTPRPEAQREPLPTLQDEMKSVESARILEALERCDGNQSEAARQLGMPRRTLVSRLTALGLTRRRTSGDGI
jgi:DNA-binding NtrC family response regulator